MRRIETKKTFFFLPSLRRMQPRNPNLHAIWIKKKESDDCEEEKT